MLDDVSEVKGAALPAATITFVTSAVDPVTAASKTRIENSVQSTDEILAACTIGIASIEAAMRVVYRAGFIMIFDP